MSCVKIDAANVEKIFSSIDTILCDCDGVLYHLNTPIPGVVPVVEKLKQMDKKFFYITNNSTKSREDFVQKCNAMGYPAVEHDIVGSAFVTAQYLKSQYKYSGKAYVVGHQGLAMELEAAGIKSIGVGPDVLNEASFSKDLEQFKPDPDVRCVVVGIDLNFSYVKASKAVMYLRDKDCLFVATNPDPSIPAGNGILLPGAGSVIAMIQTASGRHPDVICGKPNKPMFDVIMEKYKIDPARTIMIGDRLDTDILFAGRCKLQSLLVLTGSSNMDEVKKLQQASSSTDDKLMIPNYYLDSLADLGPLLGETR
jgi:phosphoglycolate phosphatase